MRIIALHAPRLQQTHPVVAAVVAAVLLTGCGRKPQNDGLVDCGIHLTPVHAEFMFLPQKDRLNLDITADSIFIERRNAGDSVTLVLRQAQFAVTRAISDSLACSLRRVKPGHFEKKGVLDGTRITIWWAGTSVECDNCLNDFILKAGGNDFVVPSKRLKPLRDAVQCLSMIDRMAERTLPPNRLTAEVMANPRRLTDTAGRYSVKRNR